MPIFNLNKKLERIDRRSSGYNKKKNYRKIIVKIFLGLLALFVLVYLPARVAYSSVRQLSVNVKIIAAGSKEENLDKIKEGVDKTKNSLDQLNTSLNFLFWMRFIPFLGGYYMDAKHFASAGSYELAAMQQVVTILEPHKQELGLVGHPTPGNDKVAQATKMLSKILPNIDKIEPSLKKASEEVSDVYVDKYPEKFGSTSVRSKVDAAKNMIIGAHVAVSENKSLLEKLPGVLGQPTPKNYLLLFQNDKELRATGGFITAYAFLRLDNGKLTTTSSDDIYRLDEKLLKVCLNKICPLKPPAPIVKYLPEVDGKPRSAWSMRDSNLSPDLPISLREFERMYGYLDDAVSFDGIITIDTNVVEDLIAITGQIEIFGNTYSASTDPKCNCPNVIYELEHYAEIASKGEQDRKAILGSLMQQILSKSLSSGVDKFPEFLNIGIKLANEKHIMYYMHDLGLQKDLSKLNWTGEVRKTNGDYFLINDSNFAGGKSNLYVDERVTLDISVDSSGNIKNKVTIDYKNPQPFNTWLNGILRDYVRLYVPLGSKLVSSKGSDDPVNTLGDEDLGKTYFDAFVTVRPQNSRTLSFEYSSGVKVTDKKYSLLIQKQPGAKDHHYVVKVNGKTQADFNLTSDKQIDVSL